MRLDFDPREYANRAKPNGKIGGYRPVPEGIYTVECIALDAVISKAGDRMLKATFEVINPPISDAGYIWDYLLMTHANIDALEIARERLAKWAEAAGKPDLKDTDELEHTQCRVKLVIEPGRGDYGPSNKIKFFVAPKNKGNRAAPEPDDPKPTPAKAAELDDDMPF